MPTSKDPNSYLDVERVLRAAKDAGGATFLATTLDGRHTPGAASSWIQRAGAYRKILRARDAALRPRNEFGQSDYDDLSLYRRCGCRTGRCQAPEACTGHIVDIRVGAPIRGTLWTLDGAELTPGAATPQSLTVDPLLQDALAAALDLGLDLEEE